MKVIFIGLFLWSLNAFSQTETFPTSFDRTFAEIPFQFQPNLFTDEKLFEMPVSNLMMQNKLGIPTAKVENIIYKPFIYDWGKVSQRIQDYKFAHYSCSRQDVNSRDLLVGVLTNDIFDHLLHKALSIK
jgi:hypothetical protein